MGEERAPEGNGGGWRKERCLGKLCPPPTAAQGRAEDAAVDMLHPAVGPAAREDGLCAGPRGPALPQPPTCTCSRPHAFRVVDSDPFYLDPWGCVSVHTRGPRSFADGTVVAPLGRCWSCSWALAGLVLRPGLGWTATGIQRQT